MSRNRKSKENIRKQKSTSSLYKYAMIIWLLVIVGAILLLKGVPLNEVLARAEPSSADPLQGVVQIESEIVKEESGNSGELPASLLKSALGNGKPTFVFFHSNNCESCIQMIDIVNEVYPEFKIHVVLVDVNVYDPQNEGLLNREGINFIPTLVFYDSAGNRQIHVGVMQSQDLRTKLTEVIQ